MKGEVSAAFEDDDEFDLDNSDDLNRFINKYEEILTTNKEKTLVGPSSGTVKLREGLLTALMNSVIC